MIRIKEWPLHDAISDIYGNFEIKLNVEITYPLASRSSEEEVRAELYSQEILHDVGFDVEFLSLDNSFPKVTFRRVAKPRQEDRHPTWLLYGI